MSTRQALKKVTCRSSRGGSDCKENKDEPRKMSNGGWGGRRWSEWIPGLGWVVKCYQQPVCDVCGREVEQFV